MKKWLALAVVAVLAVLAVATVVSAQAPQPQQTPQPGFGRGMQGQGRMAQAEGEEGPMHDGMVAAFAEKLGLKAADIEARLDKGESMWQIASSAKWTAEQFKALMLEARTAGIDAAVKAGTLTQEQADWMKQRGQGQGMGAKRGGMNLENCPMTTDGTTTGQRGGMMGRGGGMMQQGGMRGRMAQP